MSFILDALKKSEHERQRQAIPGLVESGMLRPRQRLPLWAIALCVLLGINLIVLLVVLSRGWLTAPDSVAAATHSVNARTAPGLQKGDVPPGVMAGGTPTNDVPVAGMPTAEDRATDEAPKADGHFSPLDASPPVYAPEVPVTAVTPAPLPPAPVTRQPPAAAGSSGTHAIRRRDPVLNDGDYKADEEETLPSVSELNLTGAQALPDLHLDVHVFATNSAERFVFINMRKYHEGATLQEGPTVERIRRDGVILDYQGLRFLLPRQ